MAEQFGLTQAEQLACGCHVHVSVESPEEGVAVLDRIRVWLPVLTALSANSPYWQGEDTRYASFRSQAWGRWPSAGPIEVQGSVQRYRAMVSTLVGTGVLLDEAMAYFDARLSARYPTVEIRVADVCLRAEDAVLVAALCRGLVDTAAEEERHGGAAPAVPSPWSGWRPGGRVAPGWTTCCSTPRTGVPGRLATSSRPCWTTSARRSRDPGTWRAWRPGSTTCWRVAPAPDASGRCWRGPAGCPTSCSMPSSSPAAECAQGWTGAGERRTIRT